jgi:hypothetical protein
MKWEYMATNPFNKKVLFSMSLVGIKRLVKLERWKMAWIQPRTGCLSYGQKLSREIPYNPRYK